ncbi:MAG: 1-acyl-sn-glycerol-3-phosphate acyltransferase [Candidatus Promineofilum sp.]|nr:1-acyl-sn-glycerol-3-phosphate acyltransferase [Promineifilum sp.]
MWRYRLVRFIITLVQRTLCRLEVVGLENVPATGPYILVVNHMSTADIAFPFIAFPVQQWRFFAGEKWADHWLWGPLMAWLGVIFIDRSTVDRRALREALAAVRAGEVFGLAPEGTRSKVGAIQPGKDGAAFLAAQSGAPILPAGISNSDVLFASARRFRRARITLRIGQPFTLPELDHRPRGRDLSAYTCLIMIHISALTEPRHRGVYADSPALHALLAGEDPWPCCRAEQETAETPAP